MLIQAGASGSWVPRSPLCQKHLHQWMLLREDPQRAQIAPACVVGISRHASAKLLVGALHLGMVLLDVLAGEPKELVVVGSLEPVTTGTVDASHVVTSLA